MSSRPVFVLLALAVTAAAGGGFGCSSTGGTAIRTGPVRLPSYAGAVAIYATEATPEGATDLGVVEVHGLNDEGTVDQLLPLFAQKVAQIGGNVAVIEGVRARFDSAQRMQVERFYYGCGYGMTCSGTRLYTTNDEYMLVSMFGRAMTTKVVTPPPAVEVPAPAVTMPPAPLLPPALPSDAGAP